MTISCESTTGFKSVASYIRKNPKELLLIQSASPLANVKPLNDNHTETYASLCSALPSFELIKYKKIIIDCKCFLNVQTSGINTV